MDETEREEQLEQLKSAKALNRLTCIVIAILVIGIIIYGVREDKQIMDLSVKIGNLELNKTRPFIEGYQIGSAMYNNLPTYQDRTPDTYIALDSLALYYWNNQHLTLHEKCALAYEDAKKVWKKGAN